MALPVLQPGKPLTPSKFAEVTALLPFKRKKPSSTDRALSATVLDDDYLVGIPLAVGDYVIIVSGYFNLTTTTTQKFKTQWAFTGSWSPEARACFGAGQANTADRQNVTETQVGAFTTTQDCAYSCSVSAGWTSFKEIASVSVTSAGNFSFKWSQVTSSANLTSLKAGTTALILPSQEI